MLFESIETDKVEVVKALTQEEYTEIALRFSRMIYQFTQETGTTVAAVIAAPSKEPPEGGVYRASVIHAPHAYFRLLHETLGEDMNRAAIQISMNKRKN